MLPRGEITRRLGQDGWLPPDLDAKRSALERLIAYHARRFGGRDELPCFVAFVPGRIELLGKHTDYAGGHSVLAALDRGFLVVASANALGRVRMAEDGAEFPPLDIPLAAGGAPGEGWANYAGTVAKRVAANFPHRRLTGMDCVIASDLAVGSGMSGSSALIILVFAALAEVNALAADTVFRESMRDGIDLAMYLACVENGQSFRGLAGGKGVGTFGGSEDHTAILNARPGTVSLYRFAPTVWVADRSWPVDWGLAVSFSGARAEKTREARELYNLLSQRAAAVVEVHNRAAGTGHRTLREVADAAPPEGSLASSPDHPAATWDLPGRLEQFRLEDRVYIPEAWDALGRADGPAFGRVVTASHSASREHLRNIAPEIDGLVSLALEEGAWGASGFGAGFGGSAYAVLSASDVPAFSERWRSRYLTSYPRRATEAWFCTPRPASGLIDLSRRTPTRWVDTIFGSG